VSSPYNIKTGLRIPELDGLRGLAILLVVLNHYVALPMRGWAYMHFHYVFSLCWTGVDLFFVLSGFLIGGILLDHRDSENYFQTFYLRRICRIFPIYFLWLALFFILSRLLSNYDAQGWYGWLFNQDFSKVPKWSFALFLQNFYYAKIRLAGPFWTTVTWSLAVEEQFYLLLPTLIWLLPHRKLPHLLVSLILIVPIFRLFLYCYHPELSAYVLLPCRLDTLAIGVLCAYGIRQEKFRLWLEKKQCRLYQMLIVLLAGTGYLAVYSSSPFYFEMSFLGYTWMALLYGCLLLIVSTAKSGLIVKFMRITPLRNLGIISYSVYLMHASINMLMHGLILGKEIDLVHLSDGIVTIMALLTTLLLATLSWHFFEKPIVRWGHSFPYTVKTPDIKADGAL
jgi:peptidoglycan/LPS O-acetylase OafA/YrhL